MYLDTHVVQVHLQIYWGFFGTEEWAFKQIVFSPFCLRECAIAINP